MPDRLTREVESPPELAAFQASCLSQTNGASCQMCGHTVPGKLSAPALPAPCSQRQVGEQLVHGTGELVMPGIALFTCHGADLWVELPAPIPFADEFTVADLPALRQLARLAAPWPRWTWEKRL